MLSATIPPDSNGDLLRGITVLVVEDDQDSRELLCEYLTEAGAACHAASSGNRAFPLFCEERPDIVVSDLWMPDGDGLALVGRIRALPPEQGGLTPAIAVSGGGNAEQAVMAGYHMLITKPYEPTKITEAIEEFLRNADRRPSAVAPWTVAARAPGTVVMTFAGFLRASDTRACMDVLLRHLEKQPCEIIADFRKVTGFSVAAASVAQRTVWPMRQAIRHVRLIGGTKSAKVVAAGACKLLGLSYTVEEG